MLKAQFLPFELLIFGKISRAVKRGIKFHEMALAIE